MKIPFTGITQTHQSSNLKPLRHRSGDLLGDRQSFSFCLSQSEYASSRCDDKGKLDNFEDWDSLMRELGLLDDSNSPVSRPVDPQFSLSHHCPRSDSFDSVPNFELSSTHFLDHDLNPLELCANLGFSFVDELLQAASCFDLKELHLAQVILAQLDEQLSNPEGNSNPLQRAAFYFKEALQSLLTVSTRPTRPYSSSEVVQAISAYQVFSTVSPIVMFSDLTANQAVLEAVDRAMFVHVVDFDIGFGGKWASFMKEIADKARVLRITAVVPEVYEIESRLIGESLSQFAGELQLGVEIEFVSIQAFGILRFEAIKFRDGENTAVLLTPAILQITGTGILDDLRRLSPCVVLLVDGEGLKTPSFHGSVVNGLEYYSTVMEMLGAVQIGSGDKWIGKIEKYVIRPRILGAVEAAGGKAVPPWREAFAAAGIRPVELSWFAGLLTECLTWKLRGRGFHVAKRQEEMVLSWQGRALVATSAWRFF